MKGFALVLGGGGARGLAAVGLLEVLESEGLRPSSLAGSSIGAVIGAAYSCGVTLNELRRFAGSVGRAGFLRPSFGRGSVLSGRGLTAMVSRIVPDVSFSELRIPLTVRCTDLRDGSPAPVDRGSVRDAVRASCTFPGLFPPVRIGGVPYADGGYVDPVPVSAVSTAMPILALDPSAVPAESASLLTHTASTLRHVLQALDSTFYVLARLRLDGSHALVVRPRLGTIRFLDFERGIEAVEAGRVAALQALPQLREILTAGLTTPERIVSDQRA
jgi:NTE family protein